MAADIEDELRFHFESRIEELVAQGKSAESAHECAASEFGDVREVRRGLLSIDQRVATKRSRIEMLRDVIGDVAYSTRSLARTPGVTFAILVTLGLGVGANAAIFTLLDTIFIRPPAGVVDPGGVRRVWRTVRTQDGVAFWPHFPYLQFSAMKDALSERATLGIYAPPANMRIGTGSTAAEARVSLASAAFFSLLGTSTEIGRLYSAPEDRLNDPDAVAVLSDAYWRRAYAANPGVIGQTIMIAAHKYTVVGVAQQSFTGIDLDAVDLWIPPGLPSRAAPGGLPWWQDKNINGFSVIARPAAGIEDHELEQRVTAALRRPGPGHEVSDSAVVARLGSIVEANGPGVQSDEQRIAVRLAGVAIIVLLIACANVLNLLLSRAVRRRREIAVRLALGISRARLIRLLLVESGVLAAAAAVIAVGVAYDGGVVLRKLLLPDIHWTRSPLDWSVILLALGGAGVAGLAAGLIPALQAARPELTSALKVSSGPGVRRGFPMQTGLVVVQTALSVVLLIGAFLFVRSLTNVRHVEIGFDARRIVSVAVSYDDRSTSKDPTFPQRIAQLAERLRALPGVEATALANVSPMAGFGMMSYFTDGDSVPLNQRLHPTVNGVSSGYFAATGIHFVRGRDFPASGGATAAEVIVNRTMANGTWPGRDAIGQCLHFGARNSNCYRVVGIVDDSRMAQVLEDPKPIYYVPLSNVPASGAAFITPHFVVMRADPQHVGELTAATRTLVSQQFPGSIPSVTWLSDRLEPQYRPWKIGATLFTAFGVLALVVAVLGTYSTVSYGVNQRIHEFGVRVALGARTGDVLRLVLGQGLRMVAIGIVIGVGLALLAGRFVAALLFGVHPSDPIAILSVVAILLVVGAAAALIPAWRAARVDPVTALRAD